MSQPPNPSQPPLTLAARVELKRAALAAAKLRTPQAELELLVAQEEPPRNFFRAVTRRSGVHATSVVATVARKGAAGRWLRPEYEGGDWRPGDIARRYHEGGASAVACLTDEAHGGSLDDIRAVKAAVHLPVLRKDIILDPWQLWESRAAGADAVTLVVEALRESELVDLLILGQQLQLTTVLEVSDVEGLLRVRPYVGFPHPSYGLLAIDTRDPTTLRESPSTGVRLADLVEDRSVLMVEGGIRGPDDILKLRGVGVRIVVVSEELLRADDPGTALQELVGGA